LAKTKTKRVEAEIAGQIKIFWSFYAKNKKVVLYSIITMKVI
jgi:hypothetical protein